MLNIDAPITGPVTLSAPKKPRKPRPSELAAKAAKKKAGKKTAKPKAKKVKARKPKTGKKKAKKVVACVRSERLDLRLSKAEKAKVNAKAKKTRRTVTSIVIEAIEKIK
jgi:hypothetical protein